MGNPLSPILANIFMCYFDRKMQQSDLFPRVWVRYVDDVFVVVKSRKVKSLFEFLNAQHPTNKFMMEEEVDGILPFLDSGCFSKKD
jgi:retron-type reverse transcriptase